MLGFEVEASGSDRIWVQVFSGVYGASFCFTFALETELNPKPPQPLSPKLVQEDRLLFPVARRACSMRQGELYWPADNGNLSVFGEIRAYTTGQKQPATASAKIGVQPNLTGRWKRGAKKTFQRVVFIIHLQRTTGALRWGSFQSSSPLQHPNFRFRVWDLSPVAKGFGA